MACLQYTATPITIAMVHMYGACRAAVAPWQLHNLTNMTLFKKGTHYRMRHVFKLTSFKIPWTCIHCKGELSCHAPLFHHHQQLAPSAPIPVSTFRLLGCCRTSMTCLRLSSRSRRLLYSSWLVSSVWCWSRISSQRIFWMVLRWRNSSSCMDSC